MGTRAATAGSVSEGAPETTMSKKLSDYTPDEISAILGGDGDTSEVERQIMEAVERDDKIRAYRAKLSDFKQLDQNPNKHTERGQYALETSLHQVGYLDSMTASDDDVILSGNFRQEVSGQLFDGDVIVIETDGHTPVIHKRKDLKSDDPRARLATVAANRVQELSMEWDAEVLAALQMDEDIDLGQFFRDDELAAILGIEPEPSEDGGGQVDRAEELQEKWQVERGQVWEVPSISVPGKCHRVMCGDSTSAEDVARLMDGEKAEMMFTDPPYGVNYEGGHFHSGDVNIKRTRPKLQNDEVNIYPQFLALVSDYVDGACYMFFAGSHGYDVYKALHDLRFEVHSLIIWHKINGG